MNKKMGVLIIEDSENDALLNVKQLERLGYSVDYLRVESGMELRAALEKQEWDVVLSDFAMPHFSGIEALEIVRKKSKYIPFIFVSGMIGEDRAAEAMRDGANDYVLKDNLKRLGPSIERELRDVQLRIESEKAGQELHASEERNRTLIESAPVAILSVDMKGTITSVNPWCEKITGQAAEELVGARFLSLVHPHDATGAAVWFQEALENGDSPIREFRLQTKSGDVRYVQTKVVSLIESENLAGMVGFAADITERKRAEEAVSHLAAIVKSSSDAIIGMDLTGNVTSWNVGAEKMYGYTAKETMGKPIEMLSPPDRQEESSLLRARVLGGEEVIRTETMHVRKGARSIDASLTLSPIIGDAGAISGISTIARDITEQKAMDAQFRRTQRMETLGSLASGIAHDLNNVLTPITLGLETLQRKYADDEKTIRLLAMLESAINRGTGVVKQILTFARGSEVKRAPLELAAVVEDMKRIIEDTFPKSITATVDVRPGNWLILGDKTQIQQVLMNLCVNARDAMPKGGRLTISVKSVVIDENYAKMSNGVKPGDYVMLQVSDTGTGIRKENLEKLFEPFFTTKESGMGTGLGLSIVQGIVKGHGGFIEVESELNKRTTFKIYLPLALSQDAPHQIEFDMKPRLGHGESIIIVDDEAAIREITKSTLESYRYNVLVAEDGSEAVALFARHSDQVVLVLTDLIMPIMDGVATIHALRRLNPNLKIIATTAHPDGDQHAGIDGNVNAVLKKPYTAATLMNCITQVLENESEKS